MTKTDNSRKLELAKRYLGYLTTLENRGWKYSTATDAERQQYHKLTNLNPCAFNRYYWEARIIDLEKTARRA